MIQWHPIPDDAMAELEPIAAGRDKLSDAASNTVRMTHNFNLTGLVGEWLYSKLTGQPYNMEIKLGDGGEDFPGVDVKTTKSFKAPLLRAGKYFKFRADYYVLVVWDMKRKRAGIVGWCTRDEFKQAPLVPGKFGTSHALAEHQLHEGLPPV